MTKIREKITDQEHKRLKEQKGTQAGNVSSWDITCLMLSISDNAHPFLL